MLEKIGLPAKPSMRGANWVIDASHCQGCSSQFSFFNRKHHCRRCGGIFCNSCTQQRMVLRGQGDSPVRICDPCKKLEEAARFELRYGHKNRVAKGSSKQIPNVEDELPGESFHADGKHSMRSKKEACISNLPETGSSIFPANSSVLSDHSNSVEGRNDALNEIAGSSTPEDLRRQAMEEKKMYRVLKEEGKAEEALKAFKRGKELERQAGVLEIASRKNRRMTGKVSNISSNVSLDQIDDHAALGCDKELSSSRGNEMKGDLFSELRQLGWSDAELHDADRKTGKLSLEGELSNLLGGSSQMSEIGRKKGGFDRAQVVAHKRRALLLKREGKLAEAKEELKKAKILEKQLEEREFLGDASDSEDELATMINNMDDDNQDMILEKPLDVGASFDYLLGAADDFTSDDNFEVTDKDMNDPEIGAALKSFGWIEEDDVHEHVPLNQEELKAKVLNLKKEALGQKREGNLEEAMALLKKAKIFEQDLGIIQYHTKNNVDDPAFAAPKSKMVIQKELLSLKKKALSLRREGRLEEADEELKKGKVLEQQLEELENALKRPAAPYVSPGSMDLAEDSVETDVTDQDMHDPAMLSILKSLGWNEDESDSLSTINNVSELPKSQSEHGPSKSVRNKGEIQRELLTIKRKALSLRRQGKIGEAEEELVRARDLEKLLADLETSQTSIIQQEKHDEDNSRIILDVEGHISPHLKPSKTFDNAKSAATLPNTEFEVPKAAISILSDPCEVFWDSGKQNTIVSENLLHKQLENPSNIVNKNNDFKEEILAHKRNALVLKREGKLMEAKEELRKAKLMEKTLEEGQKINMDERTNSEDGRTQVQKPKSSRDRFKLQQESLVHKRNAMKLRREGKMREADAEFEMAKELENKLEELGAPGSSSSTFLDACGVEDLLDPQLMSALKSIGWGDSDVSTKTLNKSESQSPMKPVSSNQSLIDRAHIEEQINTLKFRALNLKHAGKHEEALEVLRSAKKLEKKLDSLG